MSTEPKNLENVLSNLKLEFALLSREIKFFTTDDNDSNSRARYKIEKVLELHKWKVSLNKKTEDKFQEFLNYLSTIKVQEGQTRQEKFLDLKSELEKIKNITANPYAYEKRVREVFSLEYTEEQGDPLFVLFYQYGLKYENLIKLLDDLTQNKVLLDNSAQDIQENPPQEVHRQEELQSDDYLSESLRNISSLSLSSLDSSLATSVMRLNLLSDGSNELSIKDKDSPDNTLSLEAITDLYNKNNMSFSKDVSTIMNYFMLNPSQRNTERVEKLKTSYWLKNHLDAFVLDLFNTEKNKESFFGKMSKLFSLGSERDKQHQDKEPESPNKLYLKIGPLVVACWKRKRESPSAIKRLRFNKTTIKYQVIQESHITPDAKIFVLNETPEMKNLFFEMIKKDSNKHFINIVARDIHDSDLDKIKSEKNGEKLFQEGSFEYYIKELFQAKNFQAQNDLKPDMIPFAQRQESVSTEQPISEVSAKEEQSSRTENEKDTYDTNKKSLPIELQEEIKSRKKASSEASASKVNNIEENTKIDDKKTDKNWQQPLKQIRNSRLEDSSTASETPETNLVPPQDRAPDNSANMVGGSKTQESESTESKISEVRPAEATKNVDSASLNESLETDTAGNIPQWGGVTIESSPKSEFSSKQGYEGEDNPLIEISSEPGSDVGSERETSSHYQNPEKNTNVSGEEEQTYSETKKSSEKEFPIRQEADIQSMRNYLVEITPKQTVTKASIDFHIHSQIDKDLFIKTVLALIEQNVDPHTIEAGVIDCSDEFISDINESLKDEFNNLGWSFEIKNSGFELEKLEPKSRPRP